MLKKIGENWKSGLTVALVSVPLSISLAIASGVSPEGGIITAVWAGLIASLFAGSNYNIVGPTGALSGLIASFVLVHGISSVSMLAVVTGIIILAAYVLRIDRYLIFIPSSVIHGFTLGVACIIAFNQLNFMFGLRNMPVHTEFIHNVLESFKHLHELSITTFITFICFFASLLCMKKYVRSIPGAVILSPLGILLGYINIFGLETLASRYGHIESKIMQLPSITFSLDIIWSAGVIALIALLETMLSAKIADGITKTKHNSGKELLGLGLANIASGLAGGIPATAALARTALNIKSGANNRISATISSLFIIVISLVCLPYFKYMPTAVIAAILVNVAYGMIETEHFGRLFAHDKINFAISLLVAFITVYKDPIIGILAGAMLSMLFFVEKLSHGYYNVAVKHPEKPIEYMHAESLKRADILVYTFSGKLAYINSQAHIARFESDLFVPYTEIVLNLQNVNFIDVDGIDAFDEIVEMLRKRNKKVNIVGVSPTIEKLLRELSPQYKELYTSKTVH